MDQYINEFLIIAMAHFLALLSPGADFVYLVNTSLNNTKKVATGAAFGIAFSNGFYIILCLLGYATVFSNSTFMMSVIKIIGGAYLLYLGIIIIRSKVIDINTQIQDRSTFIKELINGFWLSFLNPKISIFYISLFTIAINQDTPLHIQLAYGLWMFLVVLFWDILLIILIDKKGIKEKILSLRYTQKVMGLLLLGLAFSLFYSLFD